MSVSLTLATDLALAGSQDAAVKKKRAKGTTSSLSSAKRDKQQSKLSFASKQTTRRIQTNAVSQQYLETTFSLEPGSSFLVNQENGECFLANAEGKFENLLAGSSLEVHGHLAQSSKISKKRPYINVEEDSADNESIASHFPQAKKQELHTPDAPKQPPCRKEESQSSMESFNPLCTEGVPSELIMGVSKSRLPSILRKHGVLCPEVTEKKTETDTRKKHSKHAQHTPLLDLEEQERYKPFGSSQDCHTIFVPEALEPFRRTTMVAQPNQSEPLVMMLLDVHWYEESQEEPNLLCLYGIKSNGSSVLVKLHHFLPYIYFPVPERFVPAVHATVLKQNLERLLRVRKGKSASNKSKKEPKNKTNSDINHETVIVDITEVSAFPLMFYRGEKKQSFLKITLSRPNILSTVSRLLQEESVAELQRDCNGDEWIFADRNVYEGTIDFDLRFMVDTNMSGGSWIEMHPSVLTYSKEDAIVSSCDIEADIYWDASLLGSQLKVHSADETTSLFSTIAPLRALCFDVICVVDGENGGAANHESDSVVMISNIIQSVDRPTDAQKVLFTCQPITGILGVTVFLFEDEQKMLSAWRDFVIQVDPDILTGYDISNFDFRFLMRRAETLHIESFARLGRRKTHKSTMKAFQTYTAAWVKSKRRMASTSNQESYNVDIEGRIFIDVLRFIQNSHALRTYSLSDSSMEFLNETKEYLDSKTVKSLYLGSEFTRNRLARYCLEEANTAIRLMNKLQVIADIVELARVTGLSVQSVFTRGQMLRVLSLVYRFAKKDGFLVPSRQEEPRPMDEGPLIIDPIARNTIGLHQDPICLLDFASLYPSIIIGYNLCYSTILAPSDVENPLLPGSSDFTKTPTKDHFVKENVRKGVVPKILESLLSARAQVKTQLSNVTEPFMKIVLDSRQKALKVAANSVYGFTGSTASKLVCIAIAESTITFGARILATTKDHVESTYKDVEVIYGDTDSLMIKFKDKAVGDAIEYGKRIAREVSTAGLFPTAITLKYEKTYAPFFLQQIRRYAGKSWLTGSDHEGIDVKGIESVRRDTMPLVRYVIETVLDKVLLENDIPGAVQFTKDSISQVLAGRFDTYPLIMTRALWRGTESTEYSAKQVHVELAQRLKKRDPSRELLVGERLSYVLINNPEAQSQHEKSEDPVYATVHNLPLDLPLMVHKIRAPLIRVFQLLTEDAESIFEGPHTRVAVITSAASGSVNEAQAKLMKSFFQKTDVVTCLSCKQRVVAKNGAYPAVCEHCKSKEAEVYMDKVANLQAKEHLNWLTRSECGQCQAGGARQEVLCENGDCPVFYKSQKAFREVAEAASQLSRFDSSLNW